MPRLKDPEAKIAELEAELARKKAQLTREKAKLAAQKRKDDARRKIIVGAIALTHAEINPQWGAELWRTLEKHVGRDHDRLLLGLAERPETEADDGDGTGRDADQAEDAIRSQDGGALAGPFSQAG